MAYGFFRVKGKLRVLLQGEVCMPDETQFEERSGFEPRELRTILIVDESAEDGTSLTEVILALGYEVIGPATTALAAKRLAEDDEPDLVLIDVNFCDEDGQPVASYLVDELDLPVAIVTDRDDAATIEACHDVKAIGFWPKPVTEKCIRAAMPIAWHRNERDEHHKETAIYYKDRLAQRREIEMAKWLLVKHEALDEPDAMRALQKSARDHRRKLIDAVREVLEEYGEPIA